MEFDINHTLEPKVNKLPGGDLPPIIMQQLVVRPPNRGQTDIETWRNSNRGAESLVPRRSWLYDIYLDSMLDAHLHSVCEKRIMGVVNPIYQYIDATGKPVDAINKVIRSKAFKTLLRAFVEAELWGYRMAELGLNAKGELTVYCIPFKHMRPETGYIAFEQTGSEGINIREGIYANTVIEIGDTKNLGILLSVVQYAIYKRGGMGDYANFVEVFGQPLIDAEWDGVDESQFLTLQKLFDNMGQGGKFLRPAGTKINLIENKANGDGKLQSNFIDVLNKEMSKGVLGQTETTESSDSSGYAQSATHADVEADINTYDCTNALSTLNTRVAEIFKNLGLPVVDGGQFIIQGWGEEKISKKDKLKMDLSLKTEGKLPISDEYFYETYGIPKPDDYDAQKKAIEDAENEDLANQNRNSLDQNNADTPPSSGKNKNKQPPTDGTQPGKKTGKLTKLFLEYRHFFG
jgi:hypothetical protein